MAISTEAVFISWIVFGALILVLWLDTQHMPTIKIVRKTLTAADITGMTNTEVVTIIPSITGKRIMVFDASLSVTEGTIGFTSAAGANTVSLYSGASASVISGTWDKTVFTTEASTIPALLPVFKGTRSTSIGDDLTIGLANATPVFATGNGTAVVTVRYYEV